MCGQQLKIGMRQLWHVYWLRQRNFVSNHIERCACYLDGSLKKLQNSYVLVLFHIWTIVLILLIFLNHNQNVNRWTALFMFKIGKLQLKFSVDCLKHVSSFKNLSIHSLSSTCVFLLKKCFNFEQYLTACTCLFWCLLVHKRIKNFLNQNNSVDELSDEYNSRQHRISKNKLLMMDTKLRESIVCSVKIDIKCVFSKGFLWNKQWNITFLILAVGCLCH